MSIKSKSSKRKKRVRRCARKERLERVKTLLQYGKSIRAVAREIGCDEKTVRLDLQQLNGPTLPATADHVTSPIQAPETPIQAPETAITTHKQPEEVSASKIENREAPNPANELGWATGVFVRICEDQLPDPQFAIQLVDWLELHFRLQKPCPNSPCKTKIELVRLLNAEMPKVVPQDFVAKMNSLYVWLRNWMENLNRELCFEVLRKGRNYWVRKF